MGTAVAQCLRSCATNRNVAGSIPDGVIGILQWHNPPDCTMALGSTQPPTEMSTRRISCGVNAAGAYGWQPYHLSVPLSLNLGTLISWNPLGHSGPVTGLIYLYLVGVYIIYNQWCTVKQISNVLIHCIYQIIMCVRFYVNQFVITRYTTRRISHKSRSGHNVSENKNQLVYTGWTSVTKLWIVTFHLQKGSEEEISATTCDTLRYPHHIITLCNLIFCI